MGNNKQILDYMISIWYKGIIMRVIFTLNKDIKELLIKEKNVSGSSYSEIIRRAIIFYFKNRRDWKWI